MTFSKYEAEAVRVITDLGDPEGWSEMDRITYAVAADRLRDALGRYDRQLERQAGRKPQKPAQAPRRFREPHALRKARPEVYQRSGGYCEANTPACPPGRHQGEHVHHVRGREYHDARWLLHVCHEAHGYIHAHPAESYEQGWMHKRLGVA